ncbi:MAG: hypothetical protein K2X76_00905 [Sphingomonas sp.]|nr:hypothetical protein [Sphingomonas sp.]
MKAIRMLLTAFAVMLFAQQAVAQERRAVKNGFDLSAASNKRIIVFRPKVIVSAQSTGGMFEPNAAWTDEARKNIEVALAARQQALGNIIVPAPDAMGEDARRVQEYTALFAAVSRAVIDYQFFIGNRLPTKKRDNKADVFEWTLGSEIALLPGAKDADYALFIFNRDAYGSTGRKLLQVVALLGPGIAIKSGEHEGFAGLIDLKTGDLLWLNADKAMGGDVRTPEGAQKRVAQLLEGFPGANAPSGAAR